MMRFKVLTIMCWSVLTHVAYGDLIVPREPDTVPEGKVFFGWNTKVDGSGVWAEYFGRCSRCGSVFKLWGSPCASWGHCTNAGCIAEGCTGEWSVDFCAFRNVAVKDYFPIFVDDDYEWSKWPEGLCLSYYGNDAVTSCSVDKIGGCPVEIILTDAFEGCTNLQSVTISSSVKMVESGAFLGTPLYESQYERVMIEGGCITADGWLMQAYGSVTNFAVADGVRGLSTGWYEGLDDDILQSICLPASLAGCEVYLPDAYWMRRDDRILVGWNTAEDGSGNWFGNEYEGFDGEYWRSYAPITVPEGGITLYAIWLPDLWDYYYLGDGYKLVYVGDRQSASPTWKVPAAIGGIPVVALGYTEDFVVDDMTIVNVEIPDCVRSIGVGAFEWTGAYWNERNRIGDTGMVSLDGWVMSVFGEPTDLVFPEGTRGIVDGWFWGYSEELSFDKLSSVTFPSSLAGKTVKLPGYDYMCADCMNFVGWNTKADGSGAWALQRYWCEECRKMVDGRHARDDDGYVCAECGCYVGSDRSEMCFMVEIPTGGVTCYPVFVDESVAVEKRGGEFIIVDKIVSIPASLAGKKLVIPCYVDGCPWSWSCGGTGVRFMGWCTKANGQGDWLDIHDDWGHEDYNCNWYDYCSIVTVPEGGITLYAMTVSENVECERIDGGMALYYWGDEITGSTWEIPSKICGLPVVQLGSGDGCIFDSDAVDSVSIPRSVRRICSYAFDWTAVLESAREVASEDGLVTLDDWVLEVNGSHTNLVFANGARGLADGWYDYLDMEALASVTFASSMIGTSAVLPNQDWLYRDDSWFVGWNRNADGSGDWLRPKYWCCCCERYVEDMADWANRCPECGEWLDCCDGRFEITIRGGNKTLHAVFADYDVDVQRYDGIDVIFEQKTILPASLAGKTVCLPDYAEFGVPCGWGDGEMELRFLGWCTTADGKGEWIVKDWAWNQCDGCYECGYSVEVPDGGITLYAMTVPYEIDCEKVENGIALYNWGYEIDGDTWTVPSEICGQSVVQLGRGDWSEVVSAMEVTNVEIPDTVKLVNSGALTDTGAWTNAEDRIDWSRDDVELKIDDWVMYKSDGGTNIAFTAGSRGATVGWWGGIDCDAVRSITLPASMAGSRFELPPAYCDGKRFVRWNTKPDGSGVWADGAFWCGYCERWVKLEADCCNDCGENEWHCPHCLDYMYPLAEQTILVTVPAGGVTYYAIFTDVWMSFERVEDGLVLNWADIGDSTEFVIPSEYAGEPIVGIASDCFSGYTNLVSVSIPDSVRWIGEYAFYDTGVYNAQVESAGEGPLVIVIDGWVVSVFNDRSSLVLPAGVRGMADGWYRDLDCYLLRSVTFPSSLAYRSVSLPQDLYDDYGEFVGWNENPDGTGMWLGCYDGEYSDCGFSFEVPNDGLTAYAIFRYERYDERYDIGWVEAGALATITAISITNNDFRIPETVGGKKVVGIEPWAVYDGREHAGGPIAMTVPCGVSIGFPNWDESLFDCYNIWKVTFEGDGVSTKEVRLGNIYNEWNGVMLGWGTSPSMSDIVSTVNGWCYYCEARREFGFGHRSSCDDAHWYCQKCGDEDLEGFFSVQVPPEGATYYRVTEHSDGCAYLEYEECDGGVVLWCVEGTPEIYVVPSTIGGHKVVAIGEGCFSGGNDNLISVTIPDTVRWIGDYAFAECYSLVDVTLPTGLKHIGECVFEGSQIEDLMIDYAPETSYLAQGTARLVCIGYIAFLNGGWDEGGVFAGDEKNLSRRYDDGSFDIEWQYDMQYHVKATTGANGSVSGDVEGWWPLGAKLTIRAIPAADCHFCGWLNQVTGEVINTERLDITVDGTLSLCATFEKDTQSGGGGDSDEGSGYGDVDDEHGAIGDDQDPGDGDDESELQEVDLTVANVYDGLLYLDDTPAGIVQIKLAKGKAGIAKLSATIMPVMEKKVSVSGNFNVEDDVFAAQAKDGRVLELVIHADGFYGTFGKYEINGMRNLFSSQNADDKDEVADVMGKWLGAYSLAFASDSVWNALSVTIAAKGKVKISGILASGAKVSVTTQMIIGDGRCGIPVAWAKNGERLSCVIWLSDDIVEVEGMDEVVFGKASNLSAEASFAIDASELESLLGDDVEVLSEYIPDGAEITASGSKWVVMPNENGKAIAAGKLVWDKKNGEVNEDKSKIDGFNVSGLKLTYTANTGVFKGSFNVYTIARGALKNIKVNVNGIVIDGVGYGSATITRIGAVAVEIR